MSLWSSPGLHPRKLQRDRFFQAAPSVFPQFVPDHSSITTNPSSFNSVSFRGLGAQSSPMEAVEQPKTSSTLKKNVSVHAALMTVGKEDKGYANQTINRRNNQASNQQTTVKIVEFFIKETKAEIIKIFKIATYTLYMLG